MDDKTFVSIRMNKQLHSKFKSLAAYEGRSMSRQLLYLVNQCIRQFEKEHGPIDLLDDE